MADRDVRFRISADDRATPTFDRVNRELDEMQAGVRAAAKAMEGLSGSRQRIAAQSQKLVETLSDGLRKSASTAEESYSALVEKLKRADQEIAAATTASAQRGEAVRSIKAQERAATDMLKRLDEAVKSDGLDDRLKAAKAELSASQAALKTHEKNLKKAQATADRVQRKAVEDEIDRAVVSAQIPKVRKVIADLRQQTATDETKAQIKRASSDLRQLENAQRRMTTSIYAARRMMDVDGAVPNMIKDSVAGRAATKAQVDAARQAVQEVEAALANDTNRASLKATKAEVKSLTSQIKKLQAEEARLGRDLSDNGRLTTARARAENEVNAAGLAMRSVRQIERIDSPDKLRASAAVLPPDAGQRVGGWERLSRALANAATETRGASGANANMRASLSGLQNQLGQIIGVWTLYTVAVNQTAAAIEAYRTKQRFESRMSYPAKGDMKAVGQELDYVTKKADEFGLSLQDTLEDYSKFATAAQSSGLSQGDTRKIFEGLASVSTVYKLDSESFKRSLNAIQQMISKGAIQAEELKTQLGDALPGAVTMFARALGYGEDRMQDFFKDMEAGKFGVNELKKVAAYMTGEFSGSVAKAANSFEGQLNRFKSAIFNARMAIADGGLIEGVTDAMEELTEFFKSDEGKRFFIELGRGAKIALDALVLLAKNLDLIIKGALVFGAARVAGFAAGLFTFSAGATAAATAAGVLSGVLRGILAIFGGWAGAAVAGGLVLWQMFGPDTVQPQVEAQKRLEAIRDVVGQIRQAAVDAAGDVDKFAAALKKIPELTGAQGRTLVRDANASRALEADKLRGMVRDYESSLRNGEKRFIEREVRPGVKQVSFQSPEPTAAQAASLEQLNKLANAYTTGKIALAEFNSELDKMAKAGQISDKTAASLQEQAAKVDVLADQHGLLKDAVDATSGSADAAASALKKSTAATNDAANAAAEAARKQKAFEDAMRDLTKEAGSAEAKIKFDERLKEIGTQADAARKALDDMKASLDPAEFERRGAAIAAAMAENIGAARAEFLKADAAAQGFNFAIGPGAAQALAQSDVQNRIAGPVSIGIGAANFGGDSASFLKKRAVGGATRGDSFTDMKKEFRDALAAMLADLPEEIRDAVKVSSGYRSPERQKQLWEDALRKYGSPEAARKWVAPPGRSNHNAGSAADLKYSSAAAREWMHKNAGRYGLAFPLSNENWHIELASARKKGSSSSAAPAADSTTPVQQNRAVLTNLTVVGALAKGFSDAAMDKLQEFAIKRPDALSSNAAVLAMADGNTKALADIMREAGEPKIAASFEAMSVGTEAVKGAEAVVKARDDAAEAAKKEADEAKRAAEAQRDAMLSVEQRLALSKLEGEAQEKARLGFELDNMERQNGKQLSAGYRADYMSKGLDAWRNENREQLERDRQKATDAEIKRLSDAVQALQKKKDGLERDLQWAIQDRDFGKQDALKAEIAGVNAELLKAVQSAEDFNAKLGGEEAQKRIEDMRNLRAETERNDHATRDYAATMQSLGDLITGHMVSAFDSFAQKVAEGENPWRALVGAVGQAVGQILIDIGRMIVQAMVAKAVMSMLGLAMPAGSMGAGIMGNIFSGAPPLPVRHAGGTAEGSGRTRGFWSALGNLARDEHMAILQTGEEVLTRNDPRHSLNMGMAIARMQRFHDGGIVGGRVVAAAAGAPAASQKVIGGMASRGGDQPVAIHNHLDAESMLASALSTPAGQRVVLNVLSANPKKFRAALGGA